MQVQAGSSATTKKDADGAAYVLQRAFDLGVPVRHFPKHDLNVLSGQRPHQGFVLRASSLGTQQLQGDALPSESFTSLRGKRWVGELALRVLHVLHVRRVLHLLNTNPFSPPPPQVPSGAGFRRGVGPYEPGSSTTFSAFSRG